MTKKEQSEMILEHSGFDGPIFVSQVSDAGPEEPIESHYHNYHELYFYIGNGMTYTVDGKSYYLRANDIMFVKKYAPHHTTYASGQKRDRILIRFAPFILEYITSPTIQKVFKKMFEQRHISIPNTEALHTVVRLLNTIVKTSHEPITLFQQLRLRYELPKLLVLLAEHSAPPRRASTAQTKEEKEQHVEEAAAYIDAHFKEKLSLDIIADAINVNKFYLSRVFNEVMGVSIVKHISTRRLAEAERLLRVDLHSITQVSQMSGFSSMSHFIKQFKEAYGMTPGEFRQHAKEKRKRREF